MIKYLKLNFLINLRLFPKLLKRCPKKGKVLKKGLISVSSPLAKGLMSKESGSKVEIKTPSGLKNYEILNIEILR